MNPELLLGHFNRISDSPNAIPRLRSFILDLAVRGKLVEQDSKDEPASELLKQVLAEKTRLLKEGEIKKQSPLPPVEESTVPFDLPSGWSWARLGNLSRLVTSGSRDWAKFYSTDGAIFVRMGNLSRDSYQLRLDNIQRVTPPTDSEGARTRLEEGDILISITGEVGLLGLIPPHFGESYINQHTCLVRPMERLRGLYLPELFRSPFAQSQFDEPQRGLKNSFRLTDVTQFLVPLPPLAEQRRIVTRVAELMTLCDRLETAQRERETRRNRLTAASHHHLDDGANAEAFHKHADFYINHLRIISARPDQVLTLRSTLLNLAIKGRLVQQDSNDEPAVELLKCIQAEKDQLIRDGKAKKEKPLPGVTTGEEPFSAPVGWTWVRLDSLTQLITKGSSPKWQGVEYVSAADGVLFVTSENVGNYRLRKMDEPKYVEKKFNEIEPRSILRKGDILMNLVGASIGRTAVYDMDDGANINQAVALVRLVRSDSDLFTEYLLHYFNSPLAVHLMLASRVTTAQPNMSLTDAREFPVPIPPRAEQQRIVAKVNELMALCDRLETQLSTAQAETSRLLESVLQNALDDNTHSEELVNAVALQ
jgi:type I restriction enzyme S subunit